MKEKFIKFLKDEGVYDQFVKNSEYTFDDLIRFPSKYFMVDAFNWCCSPEKEPFWNRMNCKWVEESEQEKGDGGYQYIHIMKEKFIKFLKDEDIYDQFVKNSEYTFDDLAIELHSRYFIADAFNWCCSPEEEPFWDRMNFKWLEEREQEKVEEQQIVTVVKTIIKEKDYEEANSKIRNLSREEAIKMLQDARLRLNIIQLLAASWPEE